MDCHLKASRQTKPQTNNQHYNSKHELPFLSSNALERSMDSKKIILFFWLFAFWFDWKRKQKTYTNTHNTIRHRTMNTKPVFFSFIILLFYFSYFNFDTCKMLLLLCKSALFLFTFRLKRMMISKCQRKC